MTNAGLSLVRTLLAEGNASWMVNPGGASIDVVDMLARVGAKVLFIDCERTAVNIESVSAMTRCAHSHRMVVLLRTESMQPEILVRYLDRGIDGIVVPHVETLAQLQAIEDTVMYVAKGKRANLFTIAQIESHAAVANIAALAAGPADGFLIGPNDLSHSMGFAGDLTRPELDHAIDGVIATLQAHEKLWGIPALPRSARELTHRGARLLYCTLEQILHTGYQEFNCLTGVHS
jgi:4-hydroxy-2-oxoheptanedioate aldolase